MVEQLDPIIEAFDLLETGLAVFDKRLQLVRCNPAFRTLRRYPDDLCRPGIALEDLLRFNAQRGDFGAGSVDGLVSERLGEIRRTDRRDIEQRMADGQVLRIRYRRSPSGALVVAMEDTTETSQAERALAASEERYSLVTRATSDGIYDWNVAEDLLFVSDHLRVMMEFDAGLKGSRAWADRVHPDDKALYAQAMRDHFRGDAEALDCEYRLLYADGGYRWIHDRGVGVRDESGRVKRLVGAVRDVTELRQREAEVKAASIRFEEAIEAVSTGFALWDADDRLIVCNSRYRLYFEQLSDIAAPGIRFADLMAVALARGIFPGHENDPAGFLQETFARRARADGLPREQRLVGGLWLQVTDHRTADGGLVSIYSDVTSLKEREAESRRDKEAAEAALAELQRAQAQLIQAEKMASLGQLTAGIAHEIKNPLNFVNNFSRLSAEMMDELSELLAEPISTLPEEPRADANDLIGTVVGNLRKIDEHGRRADSIVKNMLLHARSGDGKRQPVDVNMLAEEAMALAYHGARAADPGFNLTLVRDFDPATGSIEGEPQDLQRVLINLCANGMYAAARHAADAGGEARLSVATRRENDEVILEVHDNGAGVPADVRDKIFQPFFTTKPTGEGTGLGLSMSYDIVRKHGGFLTLEEAVGGGARFRVVLPARGAHASGGTRR
ncbi:PAS-domain containing protein [Futiania mangrovi]|uniref:histidine kinase n=1 Tax=Futiania mangrovi TaxID=2959716 RepID=A0A9J6PIY9_9PROT|nr:PAS-domain containing protein [Futiania mangrovii]MCP1337776.1 PAS-domain containing protein [Futiania mangrovii]